MSGSDPAGPGASQLLLSSGDWAAARAVMAEQCTGRSPRGVVAAAAPLAAALGAHCLREGGNAFDAVTVAALAETVLLPPKCGLGGDLVAITVPADGGEPEALLAIGGAPSGLAEVAAAGRMAVDGPTSVGVPAAAAGYAALSERGRFDRRRHAAAAATLATDGFAWARICTVLAEESAELLTRQNPRGTRYLPDGRPIRPGAVTRLPGLATALEQWVEAGPRWLQGSAGAAIVDAVRSRGGTLSLDDMGFATADWVPCRHRQLAGHDLWVTPAPTHGTSLLHALGELHAGGLLVGPGAAAPPPADVYRAVAAASARRQRAEGERAVDGGTSMVSCADADGTLVVVVHSNSFPRFGSGIVVDDLDLILANRAGRGFSATPGSPNFPAAGRRPATTLHAWALARAGSPARAAGATPGGINQMPWNTQLLTDLFRTDHWPGLAVVEPRWGWFPDTATVRAEAGFDPDQLGELAQAAPRLEPAPPWGLRCAQQVVVRTGRGEALVASADPRTVGAVVPA